MSAQLLEDFQVRHRDILVPMARNLEALLADHLRGIPRIDRINARAKDPVRFVAKASKTIKGAPKYDTPLVQIQDQIGARVIVYFLSDVEPVCQTILKYLTHMEELVKEPESDQAFGYFGRHYILTTPDDIIPEGYERHQVPTCFELQVRTLFQHAWSEAEHDIGYKPVSELTHEQRRKLAFTAAQAWGADVMFQELHQHASGRPH